jgi:hypothetical protein
MPQNFKVLEVQGRREWNSRHGGTNVDWELVIQHADGSQQEVVTTRKPTSPAPIYGDVIEGDILPPKFDDSRPVLKRHYAGNQSQEQRFQPEGTSTNGATVTQTVPAVGQGVYRPEQPPTPSTPSVSVAPQPDAYDRAQQTKNDSILWQVAFKKAVDTALARNGNAAPDEFIDAVGFYTERFDRVLHRQAADKLAEQVKQAFPGTQEVSDDVPVGL